MAVVRIPVRIDQASLPSPAFNIWHGRVDALASGATGTSAPLDDMLTTLHDFYLGVIGAMAGGTTITMPSSVVDVSDSYEYGVTTPGNISGGGANTLESGLALTIGWKTSIAGRRGRGRTFLGPMGQGSQDVNGHPTAGTITLVNTAIAALLSDSLSDNGWALGVWGQQTANVKNPKVLRDFTAAKVSTKYAHLRSRRD